MKIVVGVDACHSGSAKDAIGDIPGVSLHTATVRPEDYTPAGVNVRDGDSDRRTYTRAMLDSLAGPYGGDVESALRAADEARKDLVLSRSEVPVLGGASPSPTPFVPVTPRPDATFTVSTVIDRITARWAAEQFPVTSIACDRNGVVQSPATVTCSYLTPDPSIGGLKVTLKGDGTYAWEDAPGFFDMNYVLTMLKQQWSGSQLASISCDTAGFVQGPAQVGCSFADNVATGTTAITLNGDGSWRWSSTYARVATPAPARVTQAPAAACNNPYENSSWSGSLDLSFYSEQTYRTTIQFTFGRTDGDCETVPVVGAQVSDGSRTWRLDTAESSVYCRYHRAAPQGTGAYARCETIQFDLKLRRVSGPPTVGRFDLNTLFATIQTTRTQLTTTQMRGPGGAGCCEWGTFTAARR